MARVIPIFKSGDNVLTNYRLVSVLLSLSKLLEEVNTMTYYLTFITDFEKGTPSLLLYCIFLRKYHLQIVAIERINRDGLPVVNLAE